MFSKTSMFAVQFAADKEVVCLGLAMDNEDAADDEDDDEGVSLVTMRLVMKPLMMMLLLVTMDTD